MTTSIIQTIRNARGNQEKLLALVSDETLEAIFKEKPRVARRRYASELAMRLFDAESITIRYTQVVFGKSGKRKYDLTISHQALDALKDWALFSKSLDAWQAVEEDQRAYDDLLETQRKEFGKILFYRQIITSLNLTRHRK